MTSYVTEQKMDRKNWIPVQDEDIARSIALNRVCRRVDIKMDVNEWIDIQTEHILKYGAWSQEIDKAIKDIRSH